MTTLKEHDEFHPVPLDKDWQEVPGYPLSPGGQQHWLTDFIKFCDDNPKIAGAFYWSPEWYGEGMWKAFALFGADGNAKSAWNAFGVPR